jgi:hypothetical protein
MESAAAIASSLRGESTGGAVLKRCRLAGSPVGVVLSVVSLLAAEPGLGVETDAWDCVTGTTVTPRGVYEEDADRYLVLDRGGALV